MRELIIPITTGLTLFLFGMQLMRIGLMNISGDHLENFLYKFTKTHYHGFISGTIATLLLQSSSAVTVITIGLINTNLISFYQSIGIILGTNLGTVATTELITLNIDRWILPILIIGVVLILVPKQGFRASGMFISGLAIIFLGMDALQMIALPIQQSKWMELILSLPNQIYIGFLFGLVFTAIIQSSSATTALTMGMVSYQGIPLTFGIAIIFGSNIGTCFTAIIASMGGNKEGKQVATAHVLLNLMGVLLFFPLIKPFANFVQDLTSYPPTQIAHAQLLFNLVSSLLVLPFAKAFAKIVIFFAPK